MLLFGSLLRVTARIETALSSGATALSSGAISSALAEWYCKGGQGKAMQSLAEKCRELAVSAMKDGISQAALEVLKQHGYEGLTMDRVAELAGVAKGSIYHYFRNKQALVTHMFEQIIAPAVERSEQIMAQATPALEKLQAMVKMWLEYFSQHRSLFDFLFREPAVRELCFASQRTKNITAVERFSTILRQGMAEGIFRPVIPEFVAEMIIGAIQFTIERQLETGESRPLEQSLIRILDVFLHGIGVVASPNMVPNTVSDMAQAEAITGEVLQNSPQLGKNSPDAPSVG